MSNRQRLLDFLFDEKNRDLVIIYRIISYNGLFIATNKARIYIGPIVEYAEG